MRSLLTQVRVNLSDKVEGVNEVLLTQVWVMLPDKAEGVNEVLLTQVWVMVPDKVEGCLLYTSDAADDC